MKATFRINEPQRLEDTEPGDLFTGTRDDLTMRDHVFTRLLTEDLYLARLWPHNKGPAPIWTIVLAHRPSMGKPTAPVMRTGTLIGFPRERPIALLEQVELVAFRERTSTTSYTPPASARPETISRL